MSSLESALFVSLSSLLQPKNLKLSLETRSKSKIRKLLKTFHCSKNNDVERFLHHTAITFEEKGLSRTYLWIDKENLKVLAYFTIALKAITLDEELLNQIEEYLQDKKELERVLNDLLKGYPLGEHNNQIPVYLIAQIGKHEGIGKLGGYIVKVAIEKIKEASAIVGGKIIVLDVVEGNKPQYEGLTNFYRSLGFKDLYLLNHQGKDILRLYLKLE